MNERRRTARDAAVAVVERLREAGFEALFAGGCVRDMLLDQEPQDYDVATNARPEEIRRLFPRGRLVGAQFGVVLVRRFGWDLEVATYRSDGTYSDGRRPDQVEFGSREEDAQRRDFTINGMFFDPLTEAVIDHVGGRADLDARLIRTIGAPEDRFAEDHLRMLRAVRFAARLGFDVEPPTMTAIQQHAAKLTAISAERIWSELEKILTGAARARGWRLLCEANLRPTWRRSSIGRRRSTKRSPAGSKPCPQSPAMRRDRSPSCCMRWHRLRFTIRVDLCGSTTSFERRWPGCWEHCPTDIERQNWSLPASSSSGLMSVSTPCSAFWRPTLLPAVCRRIRGERCATEHPPSLMKTSPPRRCSPDSICRKWASPMDR
jgi:hypothetical protein